MTPVCQEIFIFPSLRAAKEQDTVIWHNMTQKIRERKSSSSFWEVHWPDVGGFGLQVAPALVHVIQSVLEEHSLVWAAQCFDHLRLVPVDTLVDVIVGIDLSLDVLKTQKEDDRFINGKLRLSKSTVKDSNRVASHHLYHRKLDMTAEYKWTESFLGILSQSLLFGKITTYCLQLYQRAEKFRFS